MEEALAERVESMGVSEEDKTAGKPEEKKPERSEETHEDATAEDDTSTLSNSVSMLFACFPNVRWIIGGLLCFSMHFVHIMYTVRKVTYMLQITSYSI